MPKLLLLLVFLIVIPMVLVIQNPIANAARQDAAALPDSSQDVSTRKRVLIVRPVILCDDDGMNPATIRLPKALVDQVYSKADLEILYLIPQRWDYGKGRRGEVNLDTIVEEGTSRGRITEDPRVVNLIFVSAIDGKSNLQGRGRQNGNVCLICLGPDPEENDPATEAFVIAHEIGHCLNLVYPVDDPDVPDDVPNLQGDGPMEDRLAAAGLTDSQRDTVLQSPLVNDRVHFSSLEETKKRVLDETWDPYISTVTDGMLRYSLGLPADEPVPGDPEVRLEFITQKYPEFAGEFTDEEKEFLKTSIALLEETGGDQWPLLCRLPWNFVKVEPGFYNNAIHTRGLSIFIGSSGVNYMRARPMWALWVLAHEKIHILQRLNGDVFHSNYEALGYQSFEFDKESLERFVFKQNPDAFSTKWAFPIDGTLHYFATILEPTDDQKFNKTNILIPLEKLEDGTYKALPAIDMKAMRPWKLQFGIGFRQPGHEHPNELVAYYITYLISEHFDEWAPAGASPEILDFAREWFKDIFSIRSDDQP